jgi:ATP-dependent protease HslVU (ClpYQ) peptidase subunit
MTSVAYRDGALSADSGVTGSATYHGSITKLARRADGAIAGAAGNCANLVEFFDWFRRDDGSKLTFTGGVDFEALLISARGRVWTFGDHGIPIPLRAKFHAIGSGTKMLLAAMAAGASSPQAVKIACVLDINSRGPVRTLRLGGK